MPKILIVDDEKNVLKTLSIGLKRHQFLVEQALSGPDALKILKEHRFDFVLSDIRMHPMDGYTLALKIKEDYPTLPVILMSAYGFEDQTVEEKDGVLYPKLTKPFTVNQLLNKLQDVRKHWEGPRADVKQNVLLLCDEKARASLLPVLHESGLQAHEINMAHEIAMQVRQKKIDFILIDHAFLEQDHLKLLNELDQAAPDIPVLILVDRIGKTDVLQTKALSVTFLDRKKIFKDPAWFAGQLNLIAN